MYVFDPGTDDQRDTAAVIRFRGERRRVGVIGDDHLGLSERGEDSEKQHLTDKVSGGHDRPPS
jgi:hypothetical protein